MTDIPNARYNSPCCKDAETKKLEYDDLKVKFEDEEAGEYESSIPVFTCKECGNKYAIERVTEKVSFDEIREVQRIQEKIMERLGEADGMPPEDLYKELGCRRSHFKDALKVLEVEGRIQSNLDREIELRDEK